MAGSTRQSDQKAFQEETDLRIRTLTDALASLSASVTSSLAEIHARFDRLDAATHTTPHQRSDTSHAKPDIPLRSYKLDFPRYDGNDQPEDWLFKANEFFEFHRTVDEQRLTITSFHMEGPALSWFQWMRKNQQLSSWDAFSTALLTRFGRSPYTSPLGSLTKLCQTSTVAAYQSDFESLSNRTHSLPPNFYIDCFIEGLRPDIRREVKASLPSTYNQAVHLARLHEEKFGETRRPFFNPPPPGPTPPPLLLSTPAAPTTAAPPPAPPPFRPFSPDERQARQAKGLCFHCDEKWHRGHRCASQKFFAFNSSDQSDFYTNEVYDYDDTLDISPPAADPGAPPTALPSPMTPASHSRPVPHSATIRQESNFSKGGGS